MKKYTPYQLEQTQKAIDRLKKICEEMEETGKSLAEKCQIYDKQYQDVPLEVRGDLSLVLLNMEVFPVDLQNVSTNFEWFIAQLPMENPEAVAMGLYKRMVTGVETIEASFGEKLVGSLKMFADGKVRETIMGTLSKPADPVNAVEEFVDQIIQNLLGFMEFRKRKFAELELRLPKAGCGAE